MEDDTSRKFVISIIAVLVIILVTNNFSNLTGQPVKKIAVTKCYDFDGGGNLITQSYNGGYASYGTTTFYDKCSYYSSSGSMILTEAVCRSNTWATTETVVCTNGCIRAMYGDACKQVVQTTQKKAVKKK